MEEEVAMQKSWHEDPEKCTFIVLSKDRLKKEGATELTSMIQTQRAYSSNAKVIQTVDEMLQETTNIKR